MQQSGIALTNRGQDFNSAIAQFYPFATNVNAVLSVLNRDNAATRTLLRDTGQVFGALAQSPSQLQGFIRNSKAVFTATAARNQALQAAIPALAAFTVATRLTVDRIQRFATEANPLINELRPAARQLSPTLQQTVILAPELKSLLVNIAPLVDASKAGVPAFDQVPRRERAVADPPQAIPRELHPDLQLHQHVSARDRCILRQWHRDDAGDGSELPETQLLHYVRISNPVNPEVLTGYPHRLDSNRGNPYMAPGGYAQLLRGLSVFGKYLCTGNAQPAIGPTIPANLVAFLQDVYYTQTPGGPPCKTQAPLGQLTTGQQQTFPTLKPLP